MWIKNGSNIHLLNVIDYSAMHGTAVFSYAFSLHSYYHGRSAEVQLFQKLLKKHIS